MVNSKKKGFTIVELVIVVAVIAILAAVLIPTFSSLVKKANMSADQQAVVQMNKALALYETDKEINTFYNVIDALEEAGYEGKSYKPLTSDTYFYWVKGINRIVHASKSKDVIFPLNLENEEYNETTKNWWSLSGIVPEKANLTISEDATSFNVTTAGELIALAELFKTNNSSVNNISTINIENDIDLMGASLTFGSITKSIIFNGNGNSIYNMHCDENSTYTDRSHDYGLFTNVARYTYFDITFDNIKFYNPVVSGYTKTEANSAGILIGQVGDNNTININNVTVENGVVSGFGKIGALIGRTRANVTVNMNSVNISKTEVYGVWDTAKVIGQAGSSGGRASTINCLSCNFDDIKVFANPNTSYVKDSEITWDAGKDPQNSDNTMYWQATYSGITDGITWLCTSLSEISGVYGDNEQIMFKFTDNTYSWNTAYLDENGNYSNQNSSN